MSKKILYTKVNDINNLIDEFADSILTSHKQDEIYMDLYEMFYEEIECNLSKFFEMHEMIHVTMATYNRHLPISSKTSKSDSLDQVLPTLMCISLDRKNHLEEELSLKFYEKIQSTLCEPIDQIFYYTVPTIDCGDPFDFINQDIENYLMEELGTEGYKDFLNNNPQDYPDNWKGILDLELSEMCYEQFEKIISLAYDDVAKLHIDKLMRNKFGKYVWNYEKYYTYSYTHTCFTEKIQNYPVGKKTMYSVFPKVFDKFIQQFIDPTSKQESLLTMNAILYMLVKDDWLSIFEQNL